MSEEIKNLGGRPRINLTDEQLGQVEKLAALLTIEQMADIFNIGRTTFIDIMARDPKVSGLYKSGRSKAVAGMAKNLIAQAMEGNTTAAIFYLKTQAGWKETQVIDNTSTDGSMTPAPAINIDKVEMKRILKELDDEC